jgi:hypothetical protein
MLHDDERARPWIKLFFTSLSILANLVGENDSRDLSSTYTHTFQLYYYSAQISVRASCMAGQIMSDGRTPIQTGLIICLLSSLAKTWLNIN